MLAALSVLGYRGVEMSDGGNHGRPCLPAARRVRCLRPGGGCGRPAGRATPPPGRSASAPRGARRGRRRRGRSARAGRSARCSCRRPAPPATATRRRAAHAHARADRAAVGARALQLHQSASGSPRRASSAEEVRRVVDVVDDDVHVAVVVEVAEGGAAARPSASVTGGPSRSLTSSNRPFAQVAVDHLALLVAGLGLELPTSG